MVTTAFFYNLWCVPLRACFPYQDPDNVYHWFLGDYMADAIYLLDTLLVRPRLRFVRDGIWIQDVSECRKIYMRTLGCKVDVLSLLPMDLLYFYYGPDFPLLRIPRMIRVTKAVQRGNAFVNSFQYLTVADLTVLGAV